MLFKKARSISEIIRKAKSESSNELNLSQMGLSKLPSELFELPEISFLNLSNNQFKEFPSEVFAMESLRGLEISYNPIKALPNDWKGAQNILLLNFTEMELEEIPDGFCELKSLESLYLGYNRLSRLPENFNNLKNLRHLFLHNNEFRYFPSQLKLYESLDTLTLGSKVTSLPKRISRFVNLKRLCVVENELASIPKEVAKLDRLESLELSGNKLQSIPAEVGFMPELTALRINRNDLPASLLSAENDGVGVLLSQIRSLIDENNISTLSEAKLMITGEGKVGKSCLRMALDGTIDPARDLLNSTTWGVDCGTLSLPDADDPNKAIEFNYWDFGGQKVYRITHQFFYSDQGLYLLVWDPRLGEDQCLIADWLRRIGARTGGEAKVILVATHADVEGGNYSPHVDLDRYDSSLSSMVVEQISVDSFTTKNIDVLKHAIAKHAQGMPGVKSPINNTWDKARKAALSPTDASPWMSYKQFGVLCSELGIDDPEAVRSIAATFLHRLGRGVWYGIDWENDAFLHDTIVRDPSWLAMAFMEIVQHERTKIAGGILDHNHLTEAWIHHGREDDGWKVYELDDHPRLMRMMRAQGVALPIRSSGGEKSLIPQLVPLEPPSLPWIDANDLEPDQRNLRMEVKVAPALDGFMSHLIAALEPYHMYQEDGRGTFWQKGIFLRDAEGRFRNEALIELSSEINYFQLNIVAVGEEPGFLLQQIDASIAECLKFWPGATREDKVLCPQRVGNRLCSGSFKLSSVERWLLRDQENAICHECDQVSRPSDLIFGLRDRKRSEETADRLLEYLAYKERRPAPGSIILLPAKGRWKNITTWEVLGKTRMKVQLRSELSGVLVAEKEFTSSLGLLRYLAPAAKLGSLFFAAAPLPLDLSPGFEESFGGLSDSLDKLGEQLPNGERAQTVKSASSIQNLALVADFLKQIGLSPRSYGMDLERAPDGKWYWMSANEVEQYRPTQASLPQNTAR
ncbi:COR domain-containing protein [Phaeobacter piscinae]|uniref:COR domain-containing protein n=1 Tax=Phaeobacter piscinae TaxID=1580596 RepID=UPI0039F6E523